MANSAAEATYDSSTTRAELLEAVESVRDVVADCADEAEREGTYPERGWQALQDAGLFRIKAPLELGGFEADPMTQIEIFEAVARMDTSAGWTVFVGSGTLAMITGWLPDEGVDAFMVDGRLPRVACGVAPTCEAVPVEGGYELTGRWQFASGSKHAEWFSGHARIKGGEPPVLNFIFPMDSAKRHDNWTVNALKGTGSGDVSVEKLFVPTEHSFNNFGPAARGGPLFRIPIPGLFANEHGAFAVGVAQRALDEMTELAKTKARGYVNPEGVAGRGKFQWDLGHADMALRAARAGLLAANQAGWDAALAGDASGSEIQTEMRCAAIYAAETAAQVCQTMFSYAGGKSLFVGNVIERCLRDCRASAQHAMINDAGYENRGQVLLGWPDVAALS